MRVRGGTWRRGAALGVAAAALAAQAAVRSPLAEAQRDAGLVIEAAPALGSAGGGGGSGGLSADVAVPTLALGAFRGLVTDYLWLRSYALREQGRRYEARQIAEQICRLQPRLPMVWSWLAHDLAYNLAATEPDPEARWRWIQNGIELLRDQGLRYNPDEPELYFTISRIYQDKLGSSFDDHHNYFKGRLARAMQAVLGGPSAAALAGAPDPEALLAQDPEARALVAAGQAVGLELSREAWTIEAALEQGATPFPAQAELLAAARATPAYARLLRASRRRALRELHGLDPKRMVEVDARYGPLDWRSPYALALYWAVEGARAASEGHGDPGDELRMRRIALQALKNALRRGRVTFLEDGSMYPVAQVELVPRLEALYLEGIKAAYERLEALEDPARAAAVAADRAADPAAHGGDEHDDHGAEDDGHGHRDVQAVRRPEVVEEYRAAASYVGNQLSAREDFYVEGIVLLAQYGREAEARAMLARAHAAYPENGMFAAGYEAFMLESLSLIYGDAGTFLTQPAMAQLIEGSWTQAFESLALGDDERYKGMRRLIEASRVRWERFLRSQRAEDPSAATRLRIDYDQLQTQALRRTAQQLPPGLVSRLAARLPEAARAVLLEAAKARGASAPGPQRGAGPAPGGRP